MADEGISLGPLSKQLEVLKWSKKQQAGLALKGSKHQLLWQDGEMRNASPWSWRHLGWRKGSLNDPVTEDHACASCSCLLLLQ